MGGSFSHIALHPPIYDPGHQSLMTRIRQSLAHPLSRIADILNPVRVCRRAGHVPGHDVFAYEWWDLDQRYSGHYIGHACGRCNQLVGQR